MKPNKLLNRTIIIVTALYGTFQLSAQEASTQALHIYGGEGSKTYLGCLNCNRYSDSSIWNNRGQFGRVNSDLSIWNRRAIFGSPDSEFSPWHKDTKRGPIILDANGTYYGRFTRNSKNEVTNIEWVALLLADYEVIRDDLEKYRAKFE